MIDGGSGLAVGAGGGPAVGPGAGAPFWQSWLWRLLGVGLLAVILWRVGIGELAGVLLGVRPVALLAAAGLAVLVLVLRGLRWWVLCRGLGLRVGAVEALRYYALGAFVGSATPGRLGDLAKAYYVRHRRAAGGLTAAIATVIYDRLFDLGQIAALALGAVVLLPGVDPGWGPGVVAVTLALLVLGTAYGPTRRILLAGPLGWALQRLPGGDGVVPPALPLGAMLVAHVLTGAALLCFVGETVVVARGLGILEAGWWPLAVLTALGALAGLAPFTVAGIGTRDAVFVAAAPALGVAVEALLGLSMLLLGLYVFNAAIGWVAWIFTEPGAGRAERPAGAGASTGDADAADAGPAGARPDAAGASEG